MARFRTMSAFSADAVGVGRVRAGRTVADSVANAQAGDVIWSGLNSVSLPAGFAPLDASAQGMRNSSRWAGTPLPATILGADSVDG